jgi:hypothetical protein
VFRSDCKVFGCISSKSEDYRCSVLVGVYLGFVLVFGVIYYIIHTLLYYIIIHILLYLIISYTILFFSSSLPTFSSSTSSSSQYSFYTCRYLHILIYVQSFLYNILPSPSIPFSSFPSSSFILYLSVLTYTYLYYPIFPPPFPNKLSINIKRNTHLSLSQRSTHLSIIHSILVGTYIYLFISHPILYNILPSSSNLTPHVLSEWMVEV